MLGTITACLEKVDFLKLSESIRGRANRRIAGHLFLALTVVYEIIEIFEMLLGELKASLVDYRAEAETYRFTLEPNRITALLQVQADNLGRLDYIFGELNEEIRFLSPEFAETCRELNFGNKFSVLTDAHILLTHARLPLNETFPAIPARAKQEIHRMLWFSPNPSPDDRRIMKEFLLGSADGEEKFVDVHITDGEPFFKELERHFYKDNPLELLNRLKLVADKYRTSLENNFTLSELLSDIGSIKSRYHQQHP